MMTDKKDTDKLTKKNFKGYLILDWRDKSMNVRKTKPKKSQIKPFEIPIEIDIDVEIPERPVIKAKGNIQLKKEKVNEMVIEQL